MRDEAKGVERSRRTVGQKARSICFGKGEAGVNDQICEDLRRTRNVTQDGDAFTIDDGTVGLLGAMHLSAGNLQVRLVKHQHQSTRKNDSRFCVPRRRHLMDMATLEDDTDRSIWKDLWICNGIPKPRLEPA
jgi:hypothetical protein